MHTAQALQSTSDCPAILLWVHMGVCRGQDFALSQVRGGLEQPHHPFTLWEVTESHVWVIQEGCPQVQPASHAQPSAPCTVTGQSASFSAEEAREVWLPWLLLSQLLGQAQFPRPTGLEAGCSP